jgi:predicted esterase
MQVRHVTTTIHGRLLHVERGSERLLVGFHGYAETAEPHLEELERIPGIGEWSVAAVQALHPFYTRSGAVVANWMTKQDRELAIDENLDYVRQVLAAIPRPETLVFLGFSQGAAMAARGAAFAGANPSGLVLLGGDIPEEIGTRDKLPSRVFLGRGERDDWYTAEKLKKDLSFVPDAMTCVYDGGHEWTEGLRSSIGEFLAGFVPRSSSGSSEFLGR